MSETENAYWYDDSMRLRVKRAVDSLQSAYQRGEMASVLYGDELAQKLTNDLVLHVRQVTCEEIGSAAELRRLKEFLATLFLPTGKTSAFASC